MERSPRMQTCNRCGRYWFLSGGSTMDRTWVHHCASCGAISVLAPGDVAQLSLGAFLTATGEAPPLSIPRRASRTFSPRLTFTDRMAQTSGPHFQLNSFKPKKRLKFADSTSVSPFWSENRLNPYQPINT